jgi:hypothetical protein
VPTCCGHPIRHHHHTCRGRPRREPTATERQHRQEEPSLHRPAKRLCTDQWPSCTNH